MTVTRWARTVLLVLGLETLQHLSVAGVGLLALTHAPLMLSAQTPKPLLLS